MARILITSALPYINGIKHLGNLAGSLLPADVYARSQRLSGHEVLYICATDEHGTPAELAAFAHNKDVATYCRDMHIAQAKAGADFKLSYDYFGRSSNPSNHALTQYFAQKLEENNLIEERIIQQIYSHTDNRFLPDRYVEGTCPECAYEKARGDQCDKCGRLLDPTDLIKPYSTLSGSQDVELKSTTHLFLKQSNLQDTLRSWVDNATQWPHLARSIAYKWLDEGLRDRCITRDLHWGIPVSTDENPRIGFEDKVFYVWFDAPIAYIAATQDWAQETGNDWQKWWRTSKGADEVSYVQFMGKDNVAFHTLSFPASLLGMQEDWKLVDTLKAFHWVTWYGGKFSTSKKRGVFMDQALALAPSDYWRWHLIANAPENADAAFSFEDFAARINSDLANVLGNFINRITKYTMSKFDGQVPAFSQKSWSELEENLWQNIAQSLNRLEGYYAQMEFRKAASETRLIWALGNEYLSESAPWTHYKTNKERANVGVNVGLNLAALFGIIAQPIIPDTAEVICNALAISPDKRQWKFDDIDSYINFLPARHNISAPAVLFTKIESEQINDWKAQFGGDQ